MAKKTDKTIKKQEIDSLKTLINLLDKQYGEGTVMMGRSAIRNIRTFPTNIASLDVAMGVCGIPEGKIIELFGAESSGKTTTCLHIIAACQQHRFNGDGKERMGRAAFIDAEHALDPEWATKIGVNMDDLLLSQPSNGEEAFNIAQTMAKSRLIDLVVIDSVAALVPKKELEGEIGDSVIGMQARLMSQGLRSLAGELSKSRTAIIFINQIREKIGVMFGSPETTPGGRALKFYSSIRIQISKGSPVKVGGDAGPVVGFGPHAKIIKNKVGPPFKTADYDICFGLPQRPVYGIDLAASLLDVAVTHKVVTLKGSHYSYDGQVLGNGKANAAAAVRENEQWLREIREKTYSTVRSQHTVVSSQEDLDGDFDEQESDEDSEELVADE